MSTAVINELFEEGITRSRKLSDAADEAMGAIDDMAKEAEDLAERLDSETTEARQHIRELVARMERSEAALEAAGDETESALAGLAGRSAELAAEAAEMLTRVKASLAELSTRQDQVEADLDARMTTANGEVTGLADKVHAAQTSAEDGLQQAAQALDALRAAIDVARAEFGRKCESWASAADELESGAATHAAAWSSGLTELLSRQSTALVESANAMVNEHNTAMDGLRARFVEQAPQDVAEAVATLQSAMGELGQAADSLEQALTAEAGQLGQWAETAAPLVDGVKTALDAAARME